HEFLDGVVWPMAGGSPDHAGIAANVARLLGNQLAGQPCRVFTSDLRVRVKATGLGTYPDVTVICGQLEFDPEDPKRHTVTNPRMIVEVLSPSTEEYDRGESSITTARFHRWRRLFSSHMMRVALTSRFASMAVGRARRFSRRA